MGIFSDIIGGGASILGGIFGGPAGAAAGSLIGGLIGGKGGGQAQGGTQTVNKDPWSAAQPWMRANLATGQNLQNYYQANPFNAQQQSAYGNLASGNDYLNRVTPGLLQQMSQPTGFDRNNPTARPSPLNFSAPSVSPQASQAYGGQMQQAIPAQGNMNQTANPFNNGLLTATAAPDPITQAYKDGLSRAPDAGGQAYYQAQLNSGRSIDSIRSEIANSPEARSRQQPMPSQPSMGRAVMNSGFDGSNLGG